jgi:hypothetical protein
MTGNDVSFPRRKIQRPELLSPIASLQDKKNESGNQSNYDQHPVLALEAQKVEMCDKKVQSAGSPRSFGKE